MRQGKVFYKKCKRYDIAGHAHELTFCCYRNQKFLASDRTCKWLADAINKTREKHKFSLWAYVLMPEHVHLLICPQQEGYSIAKILQSIKQPVAQKAISYLKKNNTVGLEKLDTGQKHRTYRFWQDGGGYDRNITVDETLIKAIRYIHRNPVRRGLVELPQQWYYSSAAVWQDGNGPLKIDFETYPVT